MAEMPAIKPKQDPIRHFALWMDEALSAGLVEPSAMTLATADANGIPSARQVLLKSYDQNGFVFFTNYDSRKALELAANPYACGVLWWDRLYRQVRVEGNVLRVDAKVSDAYFESRPRGSQISAWASPQSRSVSGRDELIERVGQLESEFRGQQVPRPDFWGGYSIKPVRVEFWQGQPDRLHERLRYDRDGEIWRTEFLGP